MIELKWSLLFDCPIEMIARDLEGYNNWSMWLNFEFELNSLSPCIQCASFFYVYGWGLGFKP
jgi:hypothetical protein